jgi:hypothetical protein
MIQKQTQFTLQALQQVRVGRLAEETLRLKSQVQHLKHVQVCDSSALPQVLACCSPALQRADVSNP